MEPPPSLPSFGEGTTNGVPPPPPLPPPLRRAAAARALPAAAPPNGGEAKGDDANGGDANGAPRGLRLPRLRPPRPYSHVMQVQPQSGVWHLPVQSADERPTTEHYEREVVDKWLCLRPPA